MGRLSKRGPRGRGLMGLRAAAPASSTLFVGHGSSCSCRLLDLARPGLHMHSTRGCGRSSLRRTASSAAGFDSRSLGRRLAWLPSALAAAGLTALGFGAAGFAAALATAGLPFSPSTRSASDSSTLDALVLTSTPADCRRSSSSWLRQALVLGYVVNASLSHLLPTSEPVGSLALKTPTAAARHPLSTSTEVRNAL